MEDWNMEKGGSECNKGRKHDTSTQKNGKG
jgi:hypothetical protein